MPVESVREWISLRLKAWNAWSIAMNLLSGAAAVTVLLLPGSLLAVFALIPPLLLVLTRQQRVLLHRASAIGGAGRYVIGRFVLTLVLLFPAIPRSGFVDAWWIGVGLAMLIALEAERLLKFRRRFLVPVAANLPGLAEGTQRFPYPWVFRMNCAVLALALFASVLLPESGPVVFVSVLGADALALLAVLSMVRRVRAEAASARRLPRAIRRLGPVFYLYWHERPGSSFQVAMWLEELERVGEPFAIVVRTTANFYELAGRTRLPVILRPAVADLDVLMVASVRAVFYVNNSIRNNHMIRYTELEHIQLLHGESDKSSSINPVMRMYDRDFVAGQAAIDRFAQHGIEMPASMFRIVGRPQVRGVERARRATRGQHPFRVLYAPTWQGMQEASNYSSLPIGPAIVQGLLDAGCSVIFRPHPFSHHLPEHSARVQAVCAMLARDSGSSGREHLFGRVSERDMSITDCFNQSDAMISDVSSVVSDYLHSRKPLAMVATRHRAANFRQEFPMSRGAYVIEGGAAVRDRVVKVVSEMRSGDPMRERRDVLAEHYLGDIPEERYGEHFVDVVRDELDLEPKDVPYAGSTVQDEADVSDAVR